MDCIILLFVSATRGNHAKVHIYVGTLINVCSLETFSSFFLQIFSYNIPVTGAGQCSLENVQTPFAEFMLQPAKPTMLH